jgi:hypothetical protein
VRHEPTGLRGQPLGYHGLVSSTSEIFLAITLDFRCDQVHGYVLGLDNHWMSWHTLVDELH